MKKRMITLLLLFVTAALVSACGTPNAPSAGSATVPQIQSEAPSSAPENLLVGTWEVVYYKSEVASEGPVEYTKPDDSDSEGFFIIIEADGSWEVKSNTINNRFTWQQNGDQLEISGSVSDSTGTQTICESYEIVELTETELLLSFTGDDITLSGLRKVL